MKGFAFSSLFDFIYDFQGIEGLNNIKEASDIASSESFKADTDYPLEKWETLFHETCAYLNISTRRLRLLTNTFFSGTGYKSHNMCPLPFSHLYLTNNGQVAPCNCLRTHKLGHINEKGLNEIWNDEPIKELRRSMLEGTFEYCKDFMDNFKCHQTHNILEYLPNFKYEIQRDDSMLRLDLDLDLNGKCNLACEMCEIYKGPNGTYTEENFWDQATKDFFPKLHEVAIMGGEPMIQPDVFKLMKIMAKVNPQCLWSITTNAQYSLSPKMKSLLDGVSIEQIGISLDSLVPEIYEGIRIGGKLDRPLKTIQQLIDYNFSRGHEERFLISVNTLISKKTWMEIPNFYNYTRKNRIKLNPEVLMDPHEMSIWDFEDQKKNEILNFYIDFNQDILNSRLSSIIASIFKGLPPKYKLQNLNRFNDLNDKIRSRQKDY
jgi:cyclic pyranopterin phosphate synthase